MNPPADMGPHRYTDRPFPSYRFIPGKAAHPTRDRDGHSYNEPPVRLAPFDPHDWYACEEYLYGIDLFNHGYWWEAHEALEAVWAAAGRRTETGLFMCFPPLADWSPISDFLATLTNLDIATSLSI